MDILKYRDGLVGQPGLVYCGRPKTNTMYCGQLLIGLGNPFSWKQTKLAKFKVQNLEESLSGYRHWLFRLLDERRCSLRSDATTTMKAHKQQHLKSIEPWERDYEEKTLELARRIARGEVSGLVCWCISINNYVPDKSKAKQCHTQILYGACLWLIEQGLVSTQDKKTSTAIDLTKLW